MAGTKMNLRRYGNEYLYWKEQEIIVDQAYLDLNRGLFIPLTHPYQMGTKMLDVYFNGQHILADGGYEEINEYMIRLDLGVYPENHPLKGLAVPLMLGDEIFIRTWKPEYRQGSGSGIDDLRFKSLEEEIISARRYKTNDLPYFSIDDRLDHIQERAEVKTMVFVLNRVFLGVAKLEIRFPFDGKIQEVYASCAKSGNGKTVFQIEKCSQVNYDSTPSWKNIFQDNLVIDKNEKSSNTAHPTYILAEDTIIKDDHFRIHIAELGEGIEGVTIEIKVII